MLSGTLRAVHPGRRARDRTAPLPTERAFVTIEVVLATGLSLVLLTLLTNLIVLQYGRGVLRAAADEGAHAGSYVDVDPVAACRERAVDVASGIGRMARDLAIQCRAIDDDVVATATASFDGWLPLVPTFHGHATSTARHERGPE